jgi:signal transduction histidine kinase
MKKEFNNVILNEGKRLAKLINDVLDLTKVEGGKIVLKKISFDVFKLLEDTIASQRDYADRKNITITFEQTAGELIIDADREKLFQAIDSLINNAVKFTNEYGRIKIICSSQFREVEIIISDTGIGIPEKDLPYIFQKFYRVSRPGTELPGTGVGLVFVKQVVDLHKGLITVLSESGNGTTFVLKLPKSSKIDKTED